MKGSCANISTNLSCRCDWLFLLFLRQGPSHNKARKLTEQFRQSEVGTGTTTCINSLTLLPILLKQGCLPQAMVRPLKLYELWFTKFSKKFSKWCQTWSKVTNFLLAPLPSMEEVLSYWHYTNSVICWCDCSLKLGSFHYSWKIQSWMPLWSSISVTGKCLLYLLCLDMLC